MKIFFPLILTMPILLMPLAAHAQQEGPVLTQALVRPESKTGVVPAASALTVKVNDRETPVLGFTPVTPANTQVALLIDDGLSRTAGIQLNDLRDFARSLPPATELLVGYMRNGTVEVVSPFTTDHAAAAQTIRVPNGVPGESASPYFCLSDFVKHWPGAGAAFQSGPGPIGMPALRKARFVMMITNGVDPYNGSTAIFNQDSPYVDAAVTDAQRAGVAVSSIYYRDSGFHSGSAAFSGQDYLKVVADATGGEAYYQGTFNPVSLTPFFKQFEAAISETYITSFNAEARAGGHEHLVQLKVNSTVPKLKFRHPDEVRPGNKESGSAGS